jgi:hypothetical protein
MSPPGDESDEYHGLFVGEERIYALPLFINIDGASLSQRANTLRHRIDDAMRDTRDDVDDGDDASETLTTIALSSRERRSSSHRER